MHSFFYFEKVSSKNSIYTSSSRKGKLIHFYARFRKFDLGNLMVQKMINRTKYITIHQGTIKCFHCLKGSRQAFFITVEHADGIAKYQQSTFPILKDKIASIEINKCMRISYLHFQHYCTYFWLIKFIFTPNSFLFFYSRLTLQTQH